MALLTKNNLTDYICISDSGGVYPLRSNVKVLVGLRVGSKQPGRSNDCFVKSAPASENNKINLIDIAELTKRLLITRYWSNKKVTMYSLLVSGPPKCMIKPLLGGNDFNI